MIFFHFVLEKEIGKIVILEKHAKTLRSIFGMKKEYWFKVLEYLQTTCPFIVISGLNVVFAALNYIARNRNVQNTQ